MAAAVWMLQWWQCRSIICRPLHLSKAVCCYLLATPAVNKSNLSSLNMIDRRFSQSPSFFFPKRPPHFKHGFFSRCICKSFPRDLKNIPSDCQVMDKYIHKSIHIKFSMRTCIQKDYGVSPVCWRTQEGLHLSVHPQPASSWAPPVLHSHALCHYCPPQRLDLKQQKHQMKNVIFWGRVRASVHIITPMICSSHPVCFESSVSRGGGSCPAHPHPTQWSWCSCTPLSPRWTLKKTAGSYNT